jgi:HlyD family secretion protein
MKTTPLANAALAAFAGLALAACSGSAARPMQGYVEGTYVYVSAESAGRIVARPAEAGRPVAEGAVLVRLDDSDQKSQVTGAEARLAQAAAQLANLHSGKRPEEVSVLVAQVSAARTAFNAATDDYNRKLVLRDKGVVSQTAVDGAKTAVDSAQAQVDAAERQLEVAKLPARPDEIEAAERNVAAEQAALAQAKMALERRTLKSPAAGVIEETFYEPGELVAAGQAVVSLLPADNKRIRFFLPEQRLATVKTGDRITVACDGCAAGLTAEITFVATEAEFTPPVIYSKENREKLVYRVEARPLAGAATLKAGQPVDVTLAGGGS